MGLAYGRKEPPSAPLLKSAKVRDGKVILKFKNARKGLRVKGAKLRGFQLAGPDGRFQDAVAMLEGRNVMVSSKAIKKPSQVRYAWADNPSCNLYGMEGLPVSPFRAVVASEESK